MKNIGKNLLRTLILLCGDVEKNASKQPQSISSNGPNVRHPLTVSRIHYHRYFFRQMVGSSLGYGANFLNNRIVYWISGRNLFHASFDPPLLFRRLKILCQNL
jgi:hypothetical protein